MITLAICNLGRPAFDATLCLQGAAQQCGDVEMAAVCTPWRFIDYRSSAG